MKAELGHMDIELISMELEAPRIDAADLSLPLVIYPMEV